MIAVFLSPIYILVHLYILRWLFRWLGACHNCLQKRWVRAMAGLVYAFFSLAILVGFLLPPGRLGRVMKQIGNYWLGVTLYLVLTVVIADIVRLFLKRCKRLDQKKLRSRKMLISAGAVCFFTILGLSVWGVVNARIIHTTDYEITVEKDGGKLDDIRVVLVADLHLGFNIGCRHMRRMADRINAAKPDLVVIAGDIFDNEYEALEDEQELITILRSIQSKYGVYACYGNHDIEERILAGFTFGGNNREKASDPRMDEFLEKAGVRLLRDEYVLIDDSFYLYGRPDAKRPGRGISTRRTPEEIVADLDPAKPVIVIDHEPRELQELADAGVDVDLCGHTHDGQMFPGNYITKLFWENSCGYLQKGHMHNIVTSGVGLFGPNMRVGTIAEICNIQIKFQPSDEG